MFEEALRSAVSRLDAACRAGLLQQFALIGGLAVSRWSVPRATADIDFAVALGSSGVDLLADFLKGSARVGEVGDPLLASVSFVATPESAAVPIQLLQFPAAWEKVIFHEIKFENVSGCNLPIIDWKALVLIKLYAGSLLDLEDASRILATVKPKEADRQYLRKKSVALRVSRRLGRILSD